MSKAELTHSEGSSDERTLEKAHGDARAVTQPIVEATSGSENAKKLRKKETDDNGKSTKNDENGFNDVNISTIDANDDENETRFVRGVDRLGVLQILSLSLRWLFGFSFIFWACGIVGLQDIRSDEGVSVLDINGILMGTALLISLLELLKLLFVPEKESEKNKEIKKHYGDTDILKHLPLCLVGLMENISTWKIISWNCPTFLRLPLQFVLPIIPYLTYFVFQEVCYLQIIPSIVLGAIFVYEDNPLASMYISNRITTGFATSFLLFALLQEPTPVNYNLGDGETEDFEESDRLEFLRTSLILDINFRFMHVIFWVNMFGGKSRHEPTWPLKTEDDKTRRKFSWVMVFVLFSWTYAICSELVIEGWLLETCEGHGKLFWIVLLKFGKTITKDVATLFGLLSKVISSVPPSMKKPGVGIILFLFVVSVGMILGFTLYSLSILDFIREEGEFCFSLTGLESSPLSFLIVFGGYSVLSGLLKVWNLLYQMHLDSELDDGAHLDADAGSDSSSNTNSDASSSSKFDPGSSSSSSSSSSSNSNGSDKNEQQQNIQVI